MLVLNEVVTYLNSRREHSLAVDIGNQLLTSPAIELVDVDRALLERGWQHFVDHDDKTYSLTDCISFVIMNERAIAGALTFDRHFTQAGFRVVT
jgi:predicted nucleic acid-binding protein